MDTDALRKFYFSGASSFASFSSSKRPGRPTTTDATALAPHDVTAAATVSRPSTVDPPRVGGGGGGSSHVTAVRKISSQQSLRHPSEKSTRATMPPDAATAEYMTFLRQSQELQRFHQSMVDAIDAIVANRVEKQRRLGNDRCVAHELLADIEAGHDWKLRSKYNVNQLTKDCGLALSLAELTPDDPPSTVAMDAMLSNVTSLKAQHGSKLQFAPYALVMEQAARRMGVLLASLKEGNTDATPLCRLLDTLVVQLEEMFSASTMEQTMAPFESVQQKCICTIDGHRQQREVATEEGEVNVAERLCYDIADEYECAIDNVLKKIEALEYGLLRTEGRRQVCAKYQAVPRREFQLLKDRSSALVEACRKDIKSMYSLRQKIEEVEAQTQAKVDSERRRSDAMLVRNAERQSEIFAQMEQLERELVTLERERHSEVQRRLADKDKDEHRRAEHAQFCATVEAHTIPLERTIRNMDLLIHSAEVLGELAETAFNTIRDDLDAQEKLQRDILLTARKEHLELFRQLILELGDVVRRKENMISETEEKIRQSHIQQELLSETYNPQAKKFGDIKKQLLHARDELEQDATQLKERAEKALAEFNATDKALCEAQVQFVHPVTEQEQQQNFRRSRLIELKAVTIGAPQGTSLNTKARGIQESASVLCNTSMDLNQSSAAAMSSTIPQIRAATRKLYGKVEPAPA